MKSAQHDANARWQLYEQLAGVHRVVSEEGHAATAGAAAAPAAPAAAGDTKPAATPAQESKS
jgi:hypothetical protein